MQLNYQKQLNKKYLSFLAVCNQIPMNLQIRLFPLENQGFASNVTINSKI